MPFVLRGIGRRNRWDNDLSRFPWLGPGELPADPLGDLATASCTLSVWLIDDASNIPRLVTALATKRENLANFDYILVDLRLLTDNGFKVESSPGDTPDKMANENWHRDIKELSATKLPELLRVIWGKFAFDLMLQKELEDRIREGFASGQLGRKGFNSKLLEKLKL